VRGSWECELGCWEGLGRVAVFFFFFGVQCSVFFLFVCLFVF